MDEITFLPEAWEDYLYWQEQDRRTLKRINALIRDILRGGTEDGIGKPEALKDDLAGWWSRRIDETNRIVYRQEGKTLVIAQARTHYRKH